MGADDDGRRGESQRILDRIAREAQSGGERVLNRARRHIDGDSDPDDWAERWGTRIGRVLGLVLTAALMLWLLIYILGGE